MTDPADLGEIIVTGQRRSSSGSAFPRMPTPILYPSPKAERDDNTPPIRVAPCLIPDFRARWDADAAAAGAIGRFLAQANQLGDLGHPTGPTPSQPDLANREFGQFIYRNGNQTTLGPLTYGTLLDATYPPDETGMTPFNLTGWIHSHPSPNYPGAAARPSAADWALFNHYRNFMINGGATAQQMALFTLYLVVYDNAVQPPRYVVYAFDKSDETGSAGGKEVNPNAQPCS